MEDHLQLSLSNLYTFLSFQLYFQYSSVPYFLLLSLIPSQIASFYLFIYVLHLSFLLYFGNFFANLERTLSRKSFSNLELFLISGNIPKIQVFIHKNISYNQYVVWTNKINILLLRGSISWFFLNAGNTIEFPVLLTWKYPGDSCPHLEMYQRLLFLTWKCPGDSCPVLSGVSPTPFPGIGTTGYFPLLKHSCKKRHKEDCGVRVISSV